METRQYFQMMLREVVCFLETFLSEKQNRFIVTTTNKQPVHYHLIPIKEIEFEKEHNYLLREI